LLIVPRGQGLSSRTTTLL